LQAIYPLMLRRLIPRRKKERKVRDTMKSKIQVSATLVNLFLQSIQKKYPEIHDSQLTEIGINFLGFS